MHVSSRRHSRSRLLAWCAALAVLCAQAAAFFSCSYGTAGSLPIIPPPSPPNPTVSISVAPTTITLGQSALLTWVSSGVTACTASGAWSGPQNLAGSMKVTPEVTGTLAYVLNCSIAPNGSIAQSATLTVDAMGALGSSRHIAASRQSMRVRRTDLVADVAGVGARATDPNLSDPWGFVLSGTHAAVVASRKSGISTSYDGAGRAQPASDGLPGRLPFAAGSATGGVADMVGNPGDGFIVSIGGKSAPARLIYASTKGVIAAWSPEVDEADASVVYVASDPVAYTGLAIASSSSPGERRLYAADFRNARIEVFDSSFRRQTPTPTRFAFTDPTLPPDYAPFGIAVIDDLIYVAYARRPVPFAREPVTGAGHGLIDVFTLSGDFITRLVTSGGPLNAPWAMVPAPTNAALAFGRVLLVGNTGDGTVYAFDLESGARLGPLTDESGTVLVIPSLHGLIFGNGYAGQPRATLFFTAGADTRARGWYGRLDPVAATDFSDR
jgi:uncharacterized protein (TIGR03118 family)